MAIRDTASTIYKTVSDPVIVALSTAWIGIGMVRPAKTDKDSEMFGSFGIPDILQRQHPETPTSEKLGQIPPFAEPDRFDYSKLWSLQIGDYFMPLSQTYVLRAKKRLNVSALVDGVDIIQQTRKEAKTIDCTLRLSLREGQPNLQLLERSQEQTEAEARVATLAKFLQDFYEADAVLRMRNGMINDTFGVEYVIISEYRFTPRAGAGTYTFEFSLTEVGYGENVLTFDLREISDAPKDPDAQTTGG